MERAIPSASLQKVAESTLDFTIPNFNMKEDITYRSENIKFSEIDGDWHMKVIIPRRQSFRFKLQFMIKSKMPHKSDYDRFSVKADVVYYLDQLSIHSSQIPDTFLKEKLSLSEDVAIHLEEDSVSNVKFEVKLSLSCFSNTDNLMDTNAVFRQMSSNNISMLSDPTYSDFTFVVGGNQFKVHKNILAATSPVFVQLFNSKMQESITNECIVNDIPSDIFNHMLRFIYGGILPDAITDIAFNLYEAAHYYQIKILMDICKNSIRSNLSPSNASNVVVWAELYNVEDIKRDALKQLKIDQDTLSPEIITKMIKQRESELLVLKRLTKLPKSKK